jgi:hypothetical protein
MIEARLGDKIKISCSPEEIFVISKNPLGGFTISTAWYGGGIPSKWDFSIAPDIKVFIQKSEKPANT